MFVLVLFGWVVLGFVWVFPCVLLLTLFIGFCISFLSLSSVIVLFLLGNVFVVLFDILLFAVLLFAVLLFVVFVGFVFSCSAFFFKYACYFACPCSKFYLECNSVHFLFLCLLGSFGTKWMLLLLQLLLVVIVLGPVETVENYVESYNP